MTRSKFAKAFGLLLLLAAGGALFFRAIPKGPVEAPVSAQPVAGSAVPKKNDPTFSSAKPLERVVRLYEEEGKRIGKVDSDPALTEKRLSAAAKDLSAEELAWLERQALDPANEMDARFFATYLAALARSEAAVASLKKIAMEPIPSTKNEMRFAEERALRMQAVEGIGHNCAMPSAQDDLLEIVAVEDEGVRDRAHRALYACKTGRPLEEGDREALKKLKAKGATSPGP